MVLRDTMGHMPLQFTLDTNCLLAIEEDCPQAVGVRALAARHTTGSAIVSVAGTTAAERQKDGTFLPNFSLLQERLATAGLGHLSLIKPTGVFDLSYWDWCVFAADDGSDDVALRSIHEVLFTSSFRLRRRGRERPRGAREG